MKLLFFVTQNSTKHHWKTAFMCLRGLWRNWRKPGRERAGWSNKAVGRFVSSIKPQSLSLSHSNINKKSTDLWIYDWLSDKFLRFSYCFFIYFFQIWLWSFKDVCLNFVYLLVIDNYGLANKSMIIIFQELWLWILYGMIHRLKPWSGVCVLYVKLPPIIGC